MIKSICNQDHFKDQSLKSTCHPISSVCALYVADISNKYTVNRIGNCKFICSSGRDSVPIGGCGFSQELSTGIGSISVCRSATPCCCCCFVLSHGNHRPTLI